MIVYEAYREGHYALGRPPLPYRSNGTTIYPPAKTEWHKEKIYKRFLDEDKCLKYCVKHGYRYREIEVED